MMLFTKGGSTPGILILILLHVLVNVASAFDCRTSPSHPLCAFLHNNDVTGAELEPISGQEYDSPEDYLEGAFRSQDLEGLSEEEKNILQQLLLEELSQKDHRVKRDLLKSFSTFYLPKAKQESHRQRRSVLNSFSTFFKPLASQQQQQQGSQTEGRSKRDILDSFSTFSSPKLSNSHKTKRESLDLFSNFYGPKIQESNRYRRNILGSFNGFYLPQSTADERPKRNVLDSFTSFYINKGLKEAGRPKRELADLEKRSGLDTFTSFYRPKSMKGDEASRGKREDGEVEGMEPLEEVRPESPNELPAEETEPDMEKKNGLGSFTTFYTPKFNQGKRENLGKLGSFSSFYSPRRNMREKRESLDSFSGFYRPVKVNERARRSLFRSFTGFYTPYAEQEMLE